MTDERMMRTWAEVDLDALAHNYNALRQMLNGISRSAGTLPAGIMGVVKANAYGHGALPVAAKLEELGADMLGVACLAEAEELREGGISLPILCLGQTPPKQAGRLLELKVTQAVGDLESGRALSAAAQAAGGVLDVHLMVDTGMGRLGFVWSEGRELDALEDMLAVCALSGLRVRGLFTHFSDADGSEEYTALQDERFQQAADELAERGVEIEICHCAASAAVLHYPCTHFDLIRPGIALYGYSPTHGSGEPALRPVMTVKSRIAAVRELPAGSFVSYGRTARLERDSRLAVVPVGYGDGYPRCLSNRMVMKIGGVPCPVVGRVCMDMCMVDVTDLPDVRPGDTAVVYDGPLLEQAAGLADTIVYELLTSISPRVPRICLEGGKIAD